MKVQLSLDNPKSIKVYKLLESRMKSKAIERALLLLVQDDEYFVDLFFGHQNGKKAKSIIELESLLQEDMTKEEVVDNDSREKKPINVEKPTLDVEEPEQEDKEHATLDEVQEKPVLDEEANVSKVEEQEHMVAPETSQNTSDKVDGSEVEVSQW